MDMTNPTSKEPNCPFCGAEAHLDQWPFIGCLVCDYGVTKRTWRDRPLESKLREEIERLKTENEELKDRVHTCHDKCTKAGCVNRRLKAQNQKYREALEFYVSIENAPAKLVDLIFRKSLGETARKALEENA